MFYTQRSFPAHFYLLVERFLDKKDQIDFWEMICKKRLLRDFYEKPFIDVFTARLGLAQQEFYESKKLSRY